MKSILEFLLPFIIFSFLFSCLISLGSGDPSRAICSSLIAESFQSISYPILPTIEKRTEVADYYYSVKMIYHIRHHSLFTPRDFDVSPFFAVIKPTIEQGFDFRSITMEEKSDNQNILTE